MSLDSNGGELPFSSDIAQVSADGRLLMFYCAGAGVVPGDTNGVTDLFIRDRQNGTTERVSLTDSGGEVNAGIGYGSMSADGRFVAFSTSATNVVPGDTNATWDIFVRDRQNGTTERVSVESAGVQGNLPSDVARISRMAATSSSTATRSCSAVVPRRARSTARRRAPSRGSPDVGGAVKSLS